MTDITANNVNGAEQRAKVLGKEIVTVRYQIPNVKRAIEFYTQ